MKSRMLNTFMRKLKNEKLAKILTNLGYFILQIYYFIARRIIKRKKNSIELNEKVVNDARKRISNVHSCPNMEDEIINLKTDNNIDLSIVLPAYNVEQYIEECIDSILGQRTRYNYELIIVNDGSKDSTDEKIKKYNDNRIKYIVQKNKGLSGARNTGINKSVGKYITFIDSDDVIAQDSIENMMNAIINENADIVVGEHYKFTSEKDCWYMHNNKRIIENDEKDAVRNPGYAWGKIYKRSLFDKVRFPLNAWYEDTLICAVMYRLAKKIVVIDEVVYGYRINANGISRTARKSPKTIDHYWVMEDVIRLMRENGLPENDVFYDILLNHMGTFLYRRISMMPDETKKDCFIMACNLVKKEKSDNYKCNCGLMEKDLKEAFETVNYKLWKLVSFLI